MTGYHDKFQKYSLHLKEVFKKLLDIEMFYGDRTGQLGTELGSVHKFAEFVKDFEDKKKDYEAILEGDKTETHQADIDSMVETVKKIQAKFEGAWKLKRITEWEDKIENASK